MISGLPRPAIDRQRQPRARLGELPHQRQRIDLALERHEAGDDRARRDRERKRPRGDRLGRRLARRPPAARRASRRAAQIAFAACDDSSCSIGMPGNVPA